LQSQKRVNAGGTLQNRVQRYYKNLKNTNNSVKKHQTYWVLLLALLFSGSMNAELYHYVGGTVNIGEWSIQPNTTKYNLSLGAAAGLGFQYEMQVAKSVSPIRFLFDAGLAIQAGATGFSGCKDAELSVPQYGFTYTFTDRRYDYLNATAVIPIMVGMQYKRLYFLAGPKIYANLLSKAYSTATVSTSDGNLNKKKLTQESGWKRFNLDMDLSLEVGVRLGEMTTSTGFNKNKSKMEYRLAVFADYGLVDMLNSSIKWPDAFKHGIGDVYMPPTDQRNSNWQKGSGYVDKNIRDHTLVMIDVLSSNDVTRAVTNLMVGVKFTVLFQAGESKKRVYYDDSPSIRRSRSRGGVKYEE